MYQQVKVTKDEVQNQSNVYISPIQYKIWYESLHQQHKCFNWNPEQYQIWYNSNYQYWNNINYNYQSPYNHSQQVKNLYSYNSNINQNLQHSYYGLSKPVLQNNIQKPANKLSRNQKRKLKKKQLQKQYEQQKQKIGKWVQLERKDLVDKIKNIQKKQQHLKEKRKQRLSHLIEIHKQVYKHMMKKNKGKNHAARQQAGNFRRKKKKVSHIKKMKQLYQQINNSRQTQTLQKKQNNDKVKEQQIQSDYVTQSQSDNDEGNKIENKEKIQQPAQLSNNLKIEHQIKDKKQINTIKYKTVGKLNGYLFNGILLRQWVDHMPCNELEDISLKLINRLSYKQAIKKVNQPEKARKLIYAGFHECKRTLKTTLDKKKSKLLIIALNVQKNNLERGNDDQMQQILQLAQSQKIPVIYTSTRSKLGRAFTGKFGPRITVVSIVNFQGYEDIMQDLLKIWKQQKICYDKLNSNNSIQF